MNARTLSQCLVTAVAAASVFSAAAFADDASADKKTADLIPIKMKLDSTYASKYVWRGIQQTKDSVFQPALTFTDTSGLSYNVWANMNSSSNSVNSGKLIEVDHTFNYTYAVKSMSMNSGFVYYMFPNTTSPDTAEVYTSACLGGMFSPAVAVNYDFDKAKGAYFSFSGGYNCNMPWMKKVANTLTLSAKVSYATSGYNKYWFYNTNKSAFTDYLLTASIPFTVGKGISVVPSINYNSVIDSDLRNAVKGAGLDADNLYGSLALSYTF